MGPYIVKGSLGCVDRGIYHRSNHIKVDGFGLGFFWWFGDGFRMGRDYGLLDVDGWINIAMGLMMVGLGLFPQIVIEVVLFVYVLFVGFAPHGSYNDIKIYSIDHMLMTIKCPYTSHWNSCTILWTSTLRNIPWSCRVGTHPAWGVLSHPQGEYAHDLVVRWRCLESWLLCILDNSSRYSFPGRCLAAHARTTGIGS